MTFFIFTYEFHFVKRSSENENSKKLSNSNTKPFIYGYRSYNLFAEPGQQNDRHPFSIKDECKMTKLLNKTQQNSRQFQCLQPTN